jgi:hypothetical protein
MSMSSRTHVVCLVAALVLSMSAFGAPVKVGPTKEHKGVILGKISLPAEGLWQAPPADDPSGLSQIHLLPPAALIEKRTGRRMAGVMRKRKIDRARSALNNISWSLQNYADKHEGNLPKTMEEFFDSKEGHGNKAWLARSIYNTGIGPQPKGPFLFLVPGVPLLKERDTRPVQTLVMELRPYVSDGKHWIITNRREVKRVKIDAALLKKHGLTILPILAKDVPAARVESRTYTLLALKRGAKAPAATLTLTNSETGKSLDCRWAYAKAAAGGEKIFQKWAYARASAWAESTTTGDVSVLKNWIAISMRQAKSEDERILSQIAPENRGRRRGRNTSLFNILGGRAAIRETLQMQLIRPADEKKEEARTVAIGEVKGVTVKSHPYAKMLGNKAGGRIGMAELVPADRFFMHFSKPAALLNLAKGGGGLGAQLGLAAGSAHDYDLVALYKARLGLNTGLSKVLIEQGIITELAFMAPDLFFMDGTDITTVSRIPTMTVVLPMLQRMGLAGLKDGAIIERATTVGTKAWWAVKGELLIASTHKGELERTLALINAKGKGSLGKSAEFRYMLTQLAPTKDTAGFAYLSDGFIRRLVGPEVKIGQYRRMMVRAEMEQCAAAAMLYRLDRHPEKPRVETLCAKGYLPGSFKNAPYAIDGQLRVHSTKWGTLDQMESLLHNPITSLTASEKKAYDTYRDEYTRFWRNFFDPIAMRLDVKEGQAELTTFILPLLDSPMYEQIRHMVASKGRGQPMRIPKISPDPVLMVSVNLTEQAWQRMLKDMIDPDFFDYLPIDPRILDQLGPSIHMAVFDSDPIIGLGSGDIFGAFGGNAMRMRSEMVAIPVMLSSLTRPCKLFIELKDPKAVKAMLARGANGRVKRERGFISMATSIVRLAGRDAWMYTINFENVIKLRFSGEVVGNYLVISNRPWAHAAKVAGVEKPSLRGAALQAWPYAPKAGLPALYTATQESLRKAAFKGNEYLLPFALVGDGNIENARSLHARVLGFKPIHPGNGTWLLKDGVLRSSTFGAFGDAMQPTFKKGEDFGVLQGVKHLGLNMQLEDEGLRAILMWKWGGTKP